MKNEIYVLDIIVDDDRFDCFYTENSDSLIGREAFSDDLRPDFGVDPVDKCWSVAKLASVWDTPVATGNVNEFNDYPGLNMIYPAFSKNAVGVLKSLLVQNGELLPLKYKEKEDEFFFFNITKMANCLNLSKSTCTFWSDPPSTAVDITEYDFYEDKVEGLDIFRIYEMPSMILVSSRFVDLVEKSGLKGFRFRKLWPLDNMKWREGKELVFK